MQASRRSSVPMSLLLNSWPQPLSDDHPSIQIDDLPPTYEEVKNEAERKGILLRIVTWNQQARDPPPAEELETYLFHCRKYHVIAVGTQECENTFAKSIIVPSKTKWETTLQRVLGTDYDALHSHSLQASHMQVHCVVSSRINCVHFLLLFKFLIFCAFINLISLPFFCPEFYLSTKQYHI